jgi:hypothetical protein
VPASERKQSKISAQAPDIAPESYHVFSEWCPELEEELDVVLSLLLRVDKWQRARLISVFSANFQGAEYIFLNPGRLHARLEGFMRLEKELPCFRAFAALLRSPLVLKQLPSTVRTRIQQNAKALGMSLDDPALPRLISQGGASLLTRRPKGVAEKIDTMARFVGRDTALAAVKRSPKLLSVSNNTIISACTSLQKALALDSGALASMLTANESLFMCTSVDQKLEKLSAALRLADKEVRAACFAAVRSQMLLLHCLLLSFLISYLTNRPVANASCHLL